MVRCPQCGAMEFPKLFPAVIVGIVDTQRNKVLVSRYANREYKRYALIAGFCEMGETVEETVHRETSLWYGFGTDGAAAPGGGILFANMGDAFFGS